MATKKHGYQKKNMASQKTWLPKSKQKKNIGKHDFI